MLNDEACSQLQLIKSNVVNRLDPAPKELIDSFTKNFNDTFLIPLARNLYSLNKGNDICLDDFGEPIHCFVSYCGNLELIRRCGFGIVAEYDECYEWYNIEAVFKIDNKAELTLKSTVKRCLCGDGSEVESWSATMCDEDIGLIFEKACDGDELLCDFIIETCQSSGHYDKNMKSLCIKDISYLSYILGV